MTETLSDKIIDVEQSYESSIVRSRSQYGDLLQIDDVREFIKKLKETIPHYTYGKDDEIMLINKIDELAGEKLI